MFTNQISELVFTGSDIENYKFRVVEIINLG